MDVKSLYAEFSALTDDPQAAASLVVAQALFNLQSEQPVSGEWLSVKEAAGLLNVAESTVRRMCHDGELPFQRFRRTLRVRKSNLHDIASGDSLFD